jgi:hypothetical protein
VLDFGKAQRFQHGLRGSAGYDPSMCRSIKTLRNLDPPATSEDVEAAALQFVRKISGYHRPSRANQEAFDRAVAEVAASAQRLLASLPARARAA